MTKHTPIQPTLYYYEHCPYCIRVLCVVGMGNIAIKRTVLLNDDEMTPTQMIGKKMLPILTTVSGQPMAESLDIMAYLSETYQVPLANDATMANEAATWLADNRLAIYGLVMPRWVKQPFAEFATTAAIDYFIQKKTQTIGDFSVALANTPSLVSELTAGLEQGANLFTKLSASPTSDAAIMLFAGLYGVRHVEGFVWPPAAHSFMQTLSNRTGLVL